MKSTNLKSDPNDALAIDAGASERVVPAFQPIQVRRAFEEICDRIRARIGAGRNALREALRSLEIAGIVRLQKGAKGGAFIREGDAGRMDEVVRDMLSL